MVDEISRYWAEASDRWDQNADVFDKSVAQGEFRNQKVLEMWKNLLQDVLGDKIPQQVMDVGTGSGFLSIVLAEMGHNVSAVDFSPRMLELASKNAAQRDLQINYQVGNALDLANFSSESFDAILSRHLIWTLPDPERAYTEWWRILRPGGKLIIIDGNWYLNRQSRFRMVWRSFSWLLIYLQERRKPGRKKNEESVSLNLPFSKVQRPEEDEKLLDSCGYKIISIKPNIYPEIYKGISGKFEYLKKCYWGPAFMIIAEKSNRGGVK